MTSAIFWPGCQELTLYLHRSRSMSSTLAVQQQLYFQQYQQSSSIPTIPYCTVLKLNFNMCPLFVIYFHFMLLLLLFNCNVKRKYCILTAPVILLAVLLLHLGQTALLSVFH